MVLDAELALVALMLTLTLQLVAMGPGAVLGGVVPPSWADPRHNPCAAQPGGWQLLLWPADGRCYRIFKRGHPCPPSMELTPGVGGGGGPPACRCPPGSAQNAHDPDSPCHQLLQQGPCPRGQYFAPLPPPAPAAPAAPVDRSATSREWGSCRAPDACPPGQVFWPRDGRCYPRLTRGPCYRGELLVDGDLGIGTCACEPRGELARYYSPLTKTCHEHYTPGPCQEKGQLFLPGASSQTPTPTCGCSRDLPHYHPDTGHCYQIDTIGPCPGGHRFSPPGGGGGGGGASGGGRAGRALCHCKDGHVRWPRDGACYRPWTRGPCDAGHLLSSSSQCVPAPCRPGRLYFPQDQGCYKVGVRGPCPKGQVVLFETAVRPAVEGISYRGVCGCSGPNARSSSNDISGKSIDDNRCALDAPPLPPPEPLGRDLSPLSPATASEAPVHVQEVPECDSKSGTVLFEGACHALYAQGPCPHGQWLVPERRGRTRSSAPAVSSASSSAIKLWTDVTGPPRTRAKCDCRPGYKPMVRVGAAGNSTALGLGLGLECQPPTVVLASFLNSHGFAGS